MKSAETDIIKYYPKVEIVTGKEVDFLSPESENGGFFDYLVRACYEKQGDTPPKQNRTNSFDEWYASYRRKKLDEARITMSSSLHHFEKLLRVFNRELLDISLLFAAGKISFDDVVPVGVVPLGMNKASMFQRAGLQVMYQSSLFWKEYYGEISPQEAQLKAAEIAWLLRFDNQGKNERGFDRGADSNADYRDMFLRTKRECLELRTKDTDRESLQVVDRVMDGKPLQIPLQLEDWICDPKIFLKEHNISAKAPHFDKKGYENWLSNKPEGYVSFTQPLSVLPAY